MSESIKSDTHDDIVVTKNSEHLKTTNWWYDSYWSYNLIMALSIIFLVIMIIYFINTTIFSPFESLISNSIQKFKFPKLADFIK
jgi:hypothetical protein